MKVIYSWLKDFVEIKISPRALADKLTMAGIEVTALEKKYGDFIFEMEITANRPDLLCVVGIAREVAAITGKALKVGSRGSALGAKVSAFVHGRADNGCRNLQIKIENKKDCPLYTAKIIKGVEVAPAPDWIKRRLELMGSRSVNNIVDITNYILFEWGEPLHAFDLDKLSQGEIIVRRATKDEGLITIDGVERRLSPEILVIADREAPVAIAGVMGGRDTEVTQESKNILLEAAIFNPILIRHARQMLGLPSESAYRFERGIDFNVVEDASWRATKLICAIAGGRSVLAKSAGSLKTKKKTLYLETSAVNKALGIDIKSTKVKKILSGLGFQVKAKTKNNFAVGIPSFRPDASLSIDLIEEVARIFGYPQIPTSLPAIKPQVTTYTARDLASEIKNILTSLGLNEVITYSLVDRESLKGMNIGRNLPLAEILNPLSKNEAVLRPTLALSLARCTAHNLSQQQEYVNIFEIAKVFYQESGHLKEELVLGAALCGEKSRFLPGQGMVKDNAGPLNLKGILEVMFERLGIKDYSLTKLDDQQLALRLGQEKIGLILSLPKSILDSLDIKNKDVWLLELSLERLAAYVNLKKRFTALAVYPGISRDISIVLREEILVEDVLGAIKDNAGPLLKEAKITDYYKGKQIPPGFKGLTISCLYLSPQRTLTEAEIIPLNSLASNILIERFAATIR